MYGITDIFPNPTVANSVHNYSIDHSTTLPAHFNKHRQDTIQWCERSGASVVMMINPLEAQFLIFIARAMKAKKVLEIGCFTGFSALAWAEALKDVEGAKVVTLDIPGDHSDFAAEAFKRYGVDKLIKFIQGDAVTTIQDLAGEKFDIIFIDANKDGYVTYLEKVLELDLLSPNAIVLADNALFQGLPANSTEANPATSDARYVELGKHMENFNKFVRQKVEEGVLENVMVPVYDGLNIIKSVR